MDFLANLVPTFVVDIWNSLPPLVQYLTITTWKILFSTLR